LDAGLPRKVAKDVVRFEYDDPATGAGRFILGTAELRRIELLETGELQWLIDIAHSGFARPQDFADFNMFIRPLHLDTTRPPGLTPRSAIKLVRQFVVGVTQMLKNTDGEYEVSIGHVSARLSRSDIITSGGAVYKADWRGTFLLRAVKLVAEYGGRIRSCAYAPCGRMFVGDRVGHQRFCSPTHAARERERLFRAKFATPEKWNEYRRKNRLRREANRNRSQEKA
jgi:hypothetical protein